MAHHYRVQVDELYAVLQEDSEAKRMVAADVIRSLVHEIILTPENGALQIDVRGDLAGILAVSLKSKRPAGGADRSQVEMVAGTSVGQNLPGSQVEVVAGGRNHQDLRTQKSRPVGAADRTHPRWAAGFLVSRVVTLRNGDRRRQNRRCGFGAVMADAS
jgi:site-specific DNA recombinase